MLQMVPAAEEDTFTTTASPQTAVSKVLPLSSSGSCVTFEKNAFVWPPGQYD